MIVCCIVFLVLGGTSLFLPDPGWAWLQCLLAILDAYALYRFYGWFYNANRFDLMRLPRDSLLRLQRV